MNKLCHRTKLTTHFELSIKNNFNKTNPTKITYFSIECCLFCYKKRKYFDLYRNCNRQKSNIVTLYRLQRVNTMLFSYFNRLYFHCINIV